MDGHCLVTDEEKAEDARGLAKGSTAGFVIGGILSATGVVLISIAASGGSSETTSLVIGPGSLGFEAKF